MQNPKTKIRSISDLHLETFDIFQARSIASKSPSTVIVPKMPDDEDTILVIAGDIHYITQMERISGFFKDLSKRFYAVVVVSGNHEYWNGNIVDADQQYTDFLKQWDNIHFLQNSHVKIKDVTFYGCTLWTELKADHDLYFAQYGMVDYRKTRLGGDMLRATDTRSLHQMSAFQIKRFCADFKKQNPGEKLYIVTHHGPSYKSCNIRFKDSPLNAAFYSAMDDFVGECGAVIWHHGHTHSSQRYMIGPTLVVCNPMGYNAGNENTEFEPKLIFEV